MKCNVGKTDRVARFTAGLAIIGAGAYFGSWWGAIGLILVVTALAGWCPAYFLIGASSCKDGDKRTET